MSSFQKVITGFITLILLQFSVPVNQLTSGEPNDELKLWFSRPAEQWDNALPVGNGHLGAMVFGNIENERLQLNEETVWAGEKNKDYHNPESLQGLKEVRELIFAGKFYEAEGVAQNKIMGRSNPMDHDRYQTLGDLILNFGPYHRSRNYRRELDLKSAIARVTYSANRANYVREIFSSNPDRVLVVRLTADKENALTFTAKLARQGNKARVQAVLDEISMSEHVQNGQGVKLFARLKVLPEGGSLVAAGDSIRVEKANAVTLLLAGATDYWGDTPSEVTRQQLTAAAAKSYAQLKSIHIADYQNYFERVDLDLGTSDAVYFATDARIEAMKNGNADPNLVKLYYQFGRYMLISSSRPGGLPANLQGIWADSLTPPWGCDYHININIQMNYWPAEVTNLSELHEPFFKFLDALRPDARKTAREVYGCKGIVAHYDTDPWHWTEPTGRVDYGMWPMGIHWSCQHLWEHYLFTEDKAWLGDFAYPIMKEAVEFCFTWLVPDPKTGKLVSGPSISPENTFFTANDKTASMVMGPTMDQMIIRDLLSNTIEAAKILKKDKSFRIKMEKTLKQLTPMQIGSDGRIMEWTEEFQEEDPGHRHISQLFGLHPGRQITKQHNPEFLEAARKTIDYRLAHGGGHTGWSRAWIINFFARLLDGDKAYENLLALLRQSTLPNLFDTHPPFQIDGNFGATAGITEMLLQSHAGEIHLLPALPSSVWQTGHIHGICARGGFDVDIDWEAGQLKQVRLLSKLGNSCKIRYGEKMVSLKTEKGKHYVLDGLLAVK